MPLVLEQSIRSATSGLFICGVTVKKGRSSFTLHEIGAIDSSLTLVGFGDLAENCGVALCRVGIECDHGATGVAFEDRDYSLRTDAQHPANETVLGEPPCRRKVHENIRPEAPLVEIDPSPSP